MICEASTSSKKKNKKRKTTSAIWEHFSPTDTTEVICKLCNKQRQWNTYQPGVCPGGGLEYHPITLNYDWLSAQPEAGHVFEPTVWRVKQTFN